MYDRLVAKVKIYYRRLRAFLGRGFVVRQTAISVQLNEENNDDAIFLIGTHRSGTSQLRRIVDSHYRIACPPESFFLRHWVELIQNKQSMRGLANLGFFDEQAFWGLRLTASYFHRSYAKCKGKNRWADKTPQYAFYLEELRELFGESSRFVFIFRHPLDVAYSLWSRGWDLMPDTGDLLKDVCLYIRKSIALQRSFLDNYPAQCHALYYDQLNENPVNVLQNMFSFLGEEWDENVIHHDKVEHDFGTEDPISRGIGGFQGSYMNWKAWSEEEIKSAIEILSDTILDLGYCLESGYSGDAGGKKIANEKQ
ncbi:MAG: sulfotransferase [Bacteroidales bacterium]|jgi:hypothetical protein|nr:sulfotransferase [Bacteroidales bacterium]